MNKKSLSTILMGLLLLTMYGCSPGPTYKKTDDGLIITLNKSGKEVNKLRLQIIDPHIIRVTASPNGSFARQQSLMRVNKSQTDVKWQVEEQNDSLFITTSALKASVDLNSGQIQFSDTAGNILLKETNNGRLFTPDTVENTPSYKIKQVFENNNHNALYGLGGNQLGFTKLNGKDLAMIQRNSEAFVPFMVSLGNPASANGHYGILWDNNSITNFGNPQHYLPLDSLTLYNAEGKPGGLTTTYQPDKTSQNSSKAAVDVKREETAIDYEFLNDLHRLPKGFELSQNASITWEGYLSSPYSGNHTFRLYWGGYIKVWLNDSLLFPKHGGAKDNMAWRQCWNPAEARINVAMTKSKKHHIKIKWIPDGGQSFLSLKWKKPKSEKEKNQISLASEMGDVIDYYFISGKNTDSVISAYRKLTGKAPIMPIWAYGFWQSRERYSSQKEILNVVKEFRQRNIPLDNIVQDWFYWEEDKWGSQKFDTARYPNPKAMIKTLHEKYNTHFMISVWPKFYVGTKPFNEFRDKGWLYEKSISDSTKDWVGYVSTFYDVFNKDARKSFWGLVNNNLFSLGVDAWWLDATEPDILSNTDIKTRKALMSPTALGPSTQNFNAYSLEQSKAFYNGQRAEKPNQRVFILTRSAFAGSQRYAAATWSGDIGATWWDMKNQIASGISFSMSGIPYWTMDIGGFSTERRYQKPNTENLAEWREQMTRWYQFGAFCPLFRAHGQPPYREPFNVAPEGSAAYKSIVYYDRLRYRMLPYIYSLAGMVYLNNYTMMRGLAMDFPNDSIAQGITDQYMFGPSLLINPIYTYKARTRKVYLPTNKTSGNINSGWYDLYTGKHFSGGQTITAEASYQRIPVFVKEGAIIPYGPKIEYTQQKQADTISLFVYTGKDGEFNLYEDDGLTYDYENDEYAIIPLEYHETGHTLTIGDREGSFDGMLTKRVFKIYWINPSKPTSLDFNTPADKIIHYEGNAITVNQ